MRYNENREIPTYTYYLHRVLALLPVPTCTKQHNGNGYVINPSLKYFANS
jgi:hypothetical protein